MKKSKLIALCMAAIISVPLLSGCGKKTNLTTNGDGSNGEKKDVTISMLFCNDSTSPYNKDWKVLKWIKEETGVTFDTQAVPASDYTTKVNMIFNSGNIPDIVTHTFPTTSQALSGLLLPINKYMDKLPNLQKFLKDNNLEKDWENAKASDGNTYLVPYQLAPFNYQNHLWVIRKDIFEKNNIPIPKTMDDIISAGKKLKEIYPDSTPITNKFNANFLMSGISQAYGTVTAYTGDGSIYNEDKGIYEFAPISQAWKDMLTTTHEMYESGVLDREYTTNDSAVYEQKVTQGKTFILFDGLNNNPKFLAEGKKVDPDFDLEVIYPPTGYDGEYALPWHAPWSQAAVLPSSLEDDPEHLEEVLSYLNWAYSEEGENLLTFGKEGETYEVKDGIKQYIGTTNSQKDYGVPHNCITLRQNLDSILSTLSKEQHDLVLEISKNCVPKVPAAAPLTEDDLDKIQVYQTSLRDYCSSMMEKFINGSEPLSNWDKYVQQCKDKGCNKMIEVYNNSLKANKK